MSEAERWQPAAFDELAALLQDELDVVGLALGGSYARSPESLDAWSDVDALLVVRDAALPRFFPDVTWLAPLGPLLGYEQHAMPEYGTLRVCFTDFRRFDLIVVPASQLGVPDGWAALAWRQRSAVFWRAEKTELASAPAAVPAPPPDTDFERLVNAYWFKGVVAVSKVKRRDTVVALQLTLELVRDSLTLALMLREREGAEWDQAVHELGEAAPPRSEADMLNSLERGALTFDWLAGAWSPDYEPRADIFCDWLDYTRFTLADS